DGTVVNVALPVLQSQLHATINDAQWIVNAYLLVLSALTLVGGSLGDRFGLVRIDAIGVVLFTGASVWCGLAPGVSQLVIARAVQGTGAALLVPASLAIITEVFPAAERGKAIGTWSALTAISIIGGPLLGGALVQAISWRAVFFINVPLAVVVLWILARHVPSIPGSGRGAIDWQGALLAIAGLGAVTWSLIEAPARRGAPVIAVGAAGVCCLVAFVVAEARSEHPLVPVALFRSRSFSGANVLTLLLYGALGGVMFLLPFEWIQVRHYTPAEAGAAFLPVVVTMSVLSPLSGRFADRFGPRLFLIAGPVIAGAGFALLAFCERGATYASAFAPALLLLGVGMGLTVAPLTTTVMTSIHDERHAGAASGVNNAVARAAGLFATAIFGAVAVVIFSADLHRRLVAFGAPEQLRRTMAAQTLRLANAAPPRGLDARTRTEVEQSVRGAFQKAFAVDMLGGAVLAAVSAAGAVAIGRPAPHRIR
ncbi:MAG TPA: MFS transporter, partial [Thermoanaerobaculia bacterium]|nr:MFS transporter [Thermoanaerobaculia bacterium]